ncbi:MAG: aconitase X catalytic domain-containing protein [Hyphomicrobiaceae bacterium]|nr:aconitase X catalytic domain-containing protein [Hyphomicrobiaceae bacterium]
MNLTDHEQAMLAGAEGPARQYAMEQIVSVGRFFDAKDTVAISQVHIMADPEALGPSGLAFLEQLAALPKAQRRVRVPTVTDPRGVDFAAYKRLGQTEAMADLERRATAAFEALGVMMTNTCINYQSVIPPVKGEHIAFGDTGSSIYANSVLGARTNFEGGPSALAAALTGRTPRYGFHLDERRRGTTHFEVTARPHDLAEWGALGAIVGRAMTSYWEVPVLSGLAPPVTSDEIKQFGAALASFGSTPLFHMPGVTPEAPDLQSAFDGPVPAARRIGDADVAALMASYRPKDDKLDVVVFAAPQLSLFEMRELAGLLDGKRLSPKVAMLAATSPDIKAAADRMGLTATIEASGAVVLSGVCFYQMYAREIGQANGWTRLMSNSAKIVNILGGYGYEPVLASMEACVESAVAGRITGLGRSA